ncbi:MAG: hypothetical protein HY880_00485 [Deltaproteobacteria bacterium]|nr:hypothetical protein [Deltaproteobacteria bacterium]
MFQVAFHFLISDNIVMPKKWHMLSISAALSWLMKFLLIGLLPYEIYTGDHLFALATILAITISFIPSIVERNYRITLPFELDLLITLALFLHTFLGEVFMFYERFALWDKMLHLFGTSVISLLAFMIVYTLHYTRKLRLTIPLIGFFTVTFAMFVGAMWEIAEFTVDALFAKTTQKGLNDTMWDLIYDLMAGIVVAILGMMYVRYSNPKERRRLTRPLGEVFGRRKPAKLK